MSNDPKSREQQVVNELMSMCPDNPSRNLLAAILHQAYCAGKVDGANEAREIVNSVIADMRRGKV
jgi:hypothetical protein